MRALLLEPDPAWLEERRRRGIDCFDEVWDGVLHVVPPPGIAHQLFEGELEVVLRPLVVSPSVRIVHNAGLYDARGNDANYRVPDIAVARTQDLSARGIEGHAELVVEILSPNDESREKFPFYAACGIPEYWIVDPITRAIEVYVLQGSAYVAVAPNADGSLSAPRFGLVVRTIDGPKLRIAWADGTAEV